MWIIKSYGGTVDIYGIGFTSDEITAQIYVFLKVAVYLSANSILGTLCRYFNIYSISTTLCLYIMEGCAGISKPTFNIDKYLFRIGLGNAYLNVVYGCQFNF